MEAGKHYYSDNEIGQLSAEGDRLAAELFGKKLDMRMLFNIPFDEVKIEGEEEINNRCREIEARIKELQKK